MRTMVLLAALPLLGACAALTTDRLPVCDGQVRRPANSYESVLLPPAPTASTPADPVEPLAGPNAGGCA